MYELTVRYEIENQIKEEGDYKKFIYRDVVCEIKRINGMGHLCGYLHLGIVAEEAREIVNKHFHCGITYENNGVYGFDCAHSGDISPTDLHHLYNGTYPGLLGDTYKTMDYVEHCLKMTVDALSEYKGADINVKDN